MPPKTNIKKRCRRRLGARSYKNYSEEMLLMAVDLVKNKSISSYDAEKQFGIPRRTIEKRVKNLHSNKPGPRFRLSEEEESKFIKVLIAAGDYGCPLSQLDFKLVVFNYLKKNNKTFVFDDKIPGDWWVKHFLERHKEKLTLRSTQNITKARAEKTLDEFKEYFSNLELSLQNIPPSNILNYDETNVSDDPGSIKGIFRRGVKYPERIMNHSKGCISIMFAATADGSLLPPYVVFKSENLWTAWCQDGPDAFYNRTKSGWFDSVMFLDWFFKVVIPWASKLEGPKLVIGDNLSSHLNPDVIELCETNHIRFVFLPSRSTQLTQPLDVAFFGPLKKAWRQILLQYKIDNPKQSSLNKCHFPLLLKQLIEAANIKKQNILSGFKATGIHPFNPYEVYKKMPEYEDISCGIKYDVDQALLDYFKEYKHPNPIKPRKNTKLNVLPGKSVSSSDIAELAVNKTIKPGKTTATKKNSTAITKLQKLAIDKQQNNEACGLTKTRKKFRNTSIKAVSKQKNLKRKYDDSSDSNSTGLVPSCESSEYDPRNDENSDTENDIYDKVIDDDKNIEVTVNRERKNEETMGDMESEKIEECVEDGGYILNENMVEVAKRFYEVMDGKRSNVEYKMRKELKETKVETMGDIFYKEVQIVEGIEDKNKKLFNKKINKENFKTQNINQNIGKVNAKRVTVLSEIKNTPQNQAYFNLKKQGPFTLKPINFKETKLELLPYKGKVKCKVKSCYENKKIQISILNKNTSENEYAISVQNDTVLATPSSSIACTNEFEAGCSKGSESNNLISYDINKNILVRYISKKKVEYFVGKIIARLENKYKVSFYKRHGRSDSTKFTKPFREDIDTIDERMIVKEVELLCLNEQDTDFVFMEDDDLVYFDY